MQTASVHNDLSQIDFLDMKRICSVRIKVCLFGTHCYNLSSNGLSGENVLLSPILNTGVGKESFW